MTKWPEWERLMKAAEGTNAALQTQERETTMQTKQAGIIRSTKGEKIETLARVTGSGTALARNMGWETSYVCFVLDDGRKVVWHSENSEKCRQTLPVGTEVALSGFLYGNRLRRVQVSKGWMLFGMGE